MQDTARWPEERQRAYTQVTGIRPLLEPEWRHSDAMKERGLPLPVAVPGVHARGVYVIYDDGRPLVEAYDGPGLAS